MPQSRIMIGTKHIEENRMKIAASIAVITVAAATLASAAFAHPKLMASMPAAKSTVAAPSVITLKFNEKLMQQFTGIDLTMTSMPGMPNKAMKIAGFKTVVGGDGKTLTAKLPKALGTGGYRIDWHAVAADTHRMTGSFAFNVR